MEIPFPEEAILEIRRSSHDAVLSVIAQTVYPFLRDIAEINRLYRLDDRWQLRLSSDGYIDLLYYGEHFTHVTELRTLYRLCAIIIRQMPEE